MTELASPDSLLGRALLGAVEGAGDEANADLLDAAYELFCRYGIQRTTMDDVARRAGVSRITVYRRVSSKEALVEQVMLREFRAYVERFLADVGRAETLEDRVAVGFASALRAVRSNPLVDGLLRAEPDLAAPSVLGPDGSTLTVIGRFLAGQLRREQEAGNIAAAVDVDLVAELMVRVSSSLLLTPSDLVDLEDAEQLETIARRYLAPMLQPVRRR
ncbi:TetR/AcrR family transcriptional regulator [Nocardioides speluncae]|uniref:TetR/AcrR family transcriptional regulator n=1 Tax=Nocardioides speluncae TaxID=2670337 RepID=UPI00197E21A6|nr:TetR/AcrR family transcriptional regulator [Nocardioides speluncae]